MNLLLIDQKNNIRNILIRRLFPKGINVYHSETLESVNKFLSTVKINIILIDIDYDLVLGETACRGTTKYRSVIGFGKATIINNDDAKRQGLDIIMKQYSRDEKFQYDDKSVAKCVIIKIEIESMSGKVSGY